MRKHQLRLRIAEAHRLTDELLHLVLQQPDGSAMPPMLPGQFVELRVDKAKVLLNRPFSIYFADSESLELLIKRLGLASEAMFSYSEGELIDVIAPLGRGFASAPAGSRVLLIGGGVGIAPMLYQAKTLKDAGVDVTVLYGDRTAPPRYIVADLANYATVHICTEDGTMGHGGFVTAHPAFGERYDLIQVCGPMPMMKAVYAATAEDAHIQFSLENKMACGLGACLCCVEKTTEGNRCVCTDGPVFYKNELPW